jgi:hypothetical protein
VLYSDDAVLAEATDRKVVAILSGGNVAPETLAALKRTS